MTFTHKDAARVREAVELDAAGGETRLLMVETDVALEEAQDLKRAIVAWLARAQGAPARAVLMGAGRAWPHYPENPDHEDNIQSMTSGYSGP